MRTLEQSRVSVEPNQESAFASSLQQLVIRYSLSWLAAGCTAGFMIAFLLFHPTFGNVLGEFSYGRWMPVHLNFQLYGWSALPMVGVLLKAFLKPGRAALGQARFVLGFWSLALAMGGVSWFAGETSSKLFLDWAGWPRLLFMAALAVLWGILGWNYLLGLRSPGRDASRPVILLKGILLAGLAVVPWALYHVTERTNYPAIDPGTGGPTGSSLLASTLGIILVLAIIPRFLSLTSYLRGFRWNENSGPWLKATLCWWCSLVVMGFLVFLPGILDRVKFTHALIAHADLAMPGLITSLNMLILANLATPPSPAIGVLTGRRAFWLWQAALAVQVVLLLGISGMEAVNHGELWKTNGYAQLFFNLRLLTGISMGTAAALWVWSAWTGKDYEHAR